MEFVGLRLEGFDPRNELGSVKPAHLFATRVRRVDDDILDFLQTPARSVQFGVAKPASMGTEILLHYSWLANKKTWTTMMHRSADL